MHDGRHLRCDGLCGDSDGLRGHEPVHDGRLFSRLLHARRGDGRLLPRRVRVLDWAGHVHERDLCTVALPTGVDLLRRCDLSRAEGLPAGYVNRNARPPVSLGWPE